MTTINNCSFSEKELELLVEIGLGKEDPFYDTKIVQTISSIGYYAAAQIAKEQKKIGTISKQDYQTIVVAIDKIFSKVVAQNIEGQTLQSTLLMDGHRDMNKMALSCGVNLEECPLVEKREGIFYFKNSSENETFEECLQKKQQNMQDFMQFCASKKPVKFLKFLSILTPNFPCSHFGFEDPAFVIDLVKKTVQSDDCKIDAADLLQPVFKIVQLLYPSDLNTPSQERDSLIEIAKIVVNHDPTAMLDFYPHLQIVQDRVLLTEIFKICAQVNGFLTAARLVQNNPPISQHDRLQILRICMIQNPLSVRRFPQEATFFDLSPFANPADPLSLSKQIQSIHTYFSHHHIVASEQLLLLLQPLCQNPDESDEEFEKRYSAQEYATHSIAAALIMAEEQKFSEQQLQSLFKDPCLPAILNFPRPDLKWQLILQTLKNGQRLSTHAATLELSTKWQSIFNMLLQRCQAQAFPPDLLNILKTASTSHFFRDGKHHQPLLEALLLLVENENLPLKAKHYLLTKAMAPFKDSGHSNEKEKVTTFCQNIHQLIALLSFNDLEICSSQDERSLQQLVFASFLKIVPLQFPEVFKKSYSQTLGTPRSPDGALLYAAKLGQLNNPRVLKDFGRYVDAVVMNKFPNERHDLHNNPHLQMIHKTHPDVLQKWFQPIPTFTFIPQATPPSSFLYQNWLHRKLIHEKNIPHLEQTAPHLYYFLVGSSPSSAPPSLFSKLAYQLMHNQNPVVENALLHQMAACPEVKGTQFAKDIQKRLELINQDRIVVIDTESPLDLLLSGTEVVGSCQDVRGNPKQSQGLLGYLLDGKIRMIAIKSHQDPQGKILGRALLKLLWDGEKPVLLLEKLYLNRASATDVAAIVQMARLKARSLGVELVSAQGSKTPYEKSLESLGGPAAFEYSDAGEGLSAHGKYTVESVNRV